MATIAICSECAGPLPHDKDDARFAHELMVRIIPRLKLVGGSASVAEFSVHVTPELVNEALIAAGISPLDGSHLATTEPS
jgi:hypothetical protein